MNFFSKIGNFFKEVGAEIKKVSWPTRKQVINYTLIVIGVSLGAAIFLGLLDYIFITFFSKSIF